MRTYLAGLFTGIMGSVFAQMPALSTTAPVSFNWGIVLAVCGAIGIVFWIWWHYFRGKTVSTGAANLEEGSAQTVTAITNLAHRAHDQVDALIAALSKHAAAAPAASPLPAPAGGASPAAVPAAATAHATAEAVTTTATATGAAMQNVFMEFPPNPNHDPMIEGPYFIRWLSGAQETPSGTPIDPPTVPAHTDGNWTVMLDQWTKNPEWGNGPPSWELAYQAAKAIGAAQPVATTPALPQPGQPGYDVVLKYSTQATPQEKAKFFEDNSAALNAYRAALPDIATVDVLLSRNLGFLLMAKYDAGSNTYMMPDGRTLGQWSLAELGLDK